MNIFYLDPDPIVSARSLCDKHVVKMILESGQMLSTAHRVLDGSMDDVLYKATHINHPSNQWTRESLHNYLWHYNLFVGMCREYTHRYKKTHATETRLLQRLAIPPKNIASMGLTKMRLAINDPECIKSDPIESYRAYYQTKQNHFKMKWTNRSPPEWFHHADIQF